MVPGFLIKICLSPMAGYPIRAPAFLGPMAGNPGPVAVRRYFPMTGHFCVFATIIAKFRTHPNMAFGRCRRAFNRMCDGMIFYIVVLGFGVEASECKAGGENCSDK